MLFTLLRLGLGTTKVEEEDISALLGATSNQWIELEKIADKHGVSAIVLDGVKAIMEEMGLGCFDHFEDKSFWRSFITRWAYGVVELGYEAGNKRQLSVVDNVQRRWAKDGIKMMLMKGIAMGTYYPIPNHRCPGDIDCYLFDDYARGNELAKAWADRVNEDWYKHSQIIYSNQLIENHQFFVHTREGRSSKHLNLELCNLLRNTSFGTLQGTDVLLPPPMFNAVFLTYHACGHFLEEGLRLKQLLDWAMFLRKDIDKIDWPLFYEICERYHLRRFAEITTDVAVHYLGVRINDSKIVSYSRYTERVIHSMLHDDDYIFIRNDSEWVKRWHIVRNLFKHRWKYHQVYRHSILRQLWFYVTGFVFKTE